jgi:hypothetical protein
MAYDTKNPRVDPEKAQKELEKERKKTLNEIEKAEDRAQREANKNNPAVNPDPITGAPGAHPVGTGAGAIGGAATGAAIGTAVGGPVGAVVGGAAGAVVGGLAGKGVAEVMDPTAEETYWRDEFANRPYVKKGSSYDTYLPAYRYGWESYASMSDRPWESVETNLGARWPASRGTSTLDWHEAKPAARDAWDRAAQRYAGAVYK